MIIIYDIASRREISYIRMLKDVKKIMFSNIRNLCSSTSISNTMTSNGRKISVPTIKIELKILII